MNSVAVLLSTYNGEKYLREQINSILEQEGVNLDLYIRDDGSSDNTVNIIKEYTLSHKNVTGYKGSNLGVGNSFMGLLYRVPKQYDYYAFSDQDDYWLPNKLQKAVERICKNDEPVLYASNQTVVDQDMKETGKRYISDPSIDYRQIVSSNMISGCTMVWNAQLCELLSEDNRKPGKELLECRIHDVWVALAAAVIGTIVYDPKSYILYRQHKDNVVGASGISVISGWFEKMKSGKTRKGRSRICNEIIKCFEDKITDSEVKKTLIRYGHYSETIKSRIELMGDKSVYDYSNETAIGLIIKIALGLF